MTGLNQNQTQHQKQKQSQKMSFVQVYAMKTLSMGTDELRNEIYKVLNENPALEIVNDNYDFSLTPKKGNQESSTANQQALEATEDKTETLQSHLIHQLNSINLSFDEMELSQKLIYNLDKNGFYGTRLAPESLINKNRPLQTREMLYKCMERIQRMDPVGTCCKNPEESLFVQAQAVEDAPQVALFILDGHIEMLNPPESSAVYKKLIDYRNEWHKKKFAQDILLDKIKFGEKDVYEAIQFILHLNIHPAQDYISDTNAEYESPDVVLRVVKKEGFLAVDDFSQGLVAGDKNHYFQIEYASGTLPELRLVPDFSFDKEYYKKAKEFLEILIFRESTLVLQGCAIVQAQRDFFLNGPGSLKALTRRQIANELRIHESTVSRVSAKNNSKYIQTEWGLFPASYFFPSGVLVENTDEKLSSEVIKQKILEKIAENKSLSDSKLTLALNDEGIKIARRTVSKYRGQLGMSNSSSLNM